MSTSDDLGIRRAELDARIKVDARAQKTFVQSARTTHALPVRGLSRVESESPPGHELFGSEVAELRSARAPHRNRSRREPQTRGRCRVEEEHSLHHGTGLVRSNERQLERCWIQIREVDEMKRAWAAIDAKGEERRLCIGFEFDGKRQSNGLARGPAAEDGEEQNRRRSFASSHAANITPFERDLTVGASLPKAE